MLRTKVFINLVRSLNARQRAFSTSTTMHAKYFESIDDAIKDVNDGSTILVGKNSVRKQPRLVDCLTVAISTRWIRSVRHTREPDLGADAKGQQESDLCFEQCGFGRFRYWTAAEGQANQTHAGLVRRREQGVCESISKGPNRARVRAAR